MVSYLKAHVKNKVMCGTNYRMTTPKACLSELDLEGLDEDKTGLFLNKDARRVFGLQ